ncbi:hypothetical protein [Erythrobacter dokdonensis]|jgi:hypothetical protein|uniref:Uncharacterized protein n=1 Tax=Erythrobacter dokdonensis DSW-74 TaxID=1300349 RepID=A0A1A7BGC3_9SPHN|nr:hypothetical protein [Erythrobacter dokdonensis]MEE4316632.1 hypothetical protein [Erythrobacter sp.]OBV11593.1 hypothetical protein I603_1036 [Erythrobacter dokdonensis DSW-74]
MRAFIELFENLINGVRIIIGLIVLAIMGLGLMFSAGVSYVAPKAADSFAGSAERVGSKAIEARQKARFAEDMAKDGWSYDATTVATGQDGVDDGWGD